MTSQDKFIELFYQQDARLTAGQKYIEASAQFKKEFNLDPPYDCYSNLRNAINYRRFKRSQQKKC